MGEDEKKVDWVRGPKEADLSDVPVEKIQKAHDERGIEVEVQTGGQGKSKVVKKVVEGMPAPKDESSE